MGRDFPVTQRQPQFGDFLIAGRAIFRHPVQFQHLLREFLFAQDDFIQQPFAIDRLKQRPPQFTEGERPAFRVQLQHMRCRHGVLLDEELLLEFLVSGDPPDDPVRKVGQHRHFPFLQAAERLLGVVVTFLDDLGDVVPLEAVRLETRPAEHRLLAVRTGEREASRHLGR